ncbi:Not1-domain-containing protein [Mycena kentingensis (nom. inval.)]|nr:Not1-domain-containing protein [Mycena kentingensis (nom. inval.)]
MEKGKLQGGASAFGPLKPSRPSSGSMLSALLLISLPSVLAATAEQWRSRSLYQIITDRFALEPHAVVPRCRPEEQTWCGGTWKAIRQNLDYVQQMGHTAIWISPVNQNYQGPARLMVTLTMVRYWTADVSRLNDRFGSADDLKALSAEVHRRGMLLMVDVVVNNSFYHPYCKIDWSNLTSQQLCWMGDTTIPLPDLDTENPQVVSRYCQWIADLVKTYSIDGLRVDAAKHIRKDFWPQFAKCAGVFCMGEVFDPTVSEVAAFQGSDALDSVLNYPLFNALGSAFQLPGPQNMSALVDVMAQTASGYSDATLLGNFLENQDVPRWHNLSVDPQSLYNALTFIYTSSGLPIVYYGLEQARSVFSAYCSVTSVCRDSQATTIQIQYNREPLWLSNYTNTTTYQLISTLNQLRHFLVDTKDWITQSTEVLAYTDHSIAFQKGPITTVLTNIGAPPMNHTSIAFKSSYPAKSVTIDIIGCRQFVVASGGHLSIEYTKGGTAVVLAEPETLKGSGSVGRGMETPPSSNTNIHTIVKAQIVFLLSTLTEENFERNQQEIRSLSEQHGIDTYLHFIRRLIVHSQSRLTSSTTPSSFELSNSLTFRLLVQETQRLARDPLLAPRFRDGIDKACVPLSVSSSPRPSSPLPLAKNSHLKLPRLYVSLSTTPSSSFATTPASTTPTYPPAQLSKFMSNLLSDPPPDAPVLDAAQRQTLIVATQSKYGKDAVLPILQRVLPSMSLPTGTTLVHALVQLGPEVTSEPEVVRAVLARFNISETTPPKDTFVVETITTLGRLAAEGSTLCDVGALVRALSSLSDNLNWAAVIRSFDWPDRHGVDTATLKLLIAILVNSPRDIEPHAVTGFWTTWANSLYQLRLLDALLSLPADTFNFVQLPGKRIVTVDDVSVASPTIKSLAANVQGHTWNSLELFEVLVRLADSESMEIRNCVREMLDKAIKISAELVHMGLLQVPDLPWNEIRRDYCSRLLHMFLAGHPNHQLVFMRIWQFRPEYLTDAFRDFYAENPLNITRILDVAQDLKILESLLEVRPFVFALDVAALASRREYLNLDKWLADNVTQHGGEFLHSILEFLDKKMEGEKVSRMSDPAVDNRTMALNPNTIAIILRVIRNSASSIYPTDKEHSVEVRNACLQVHPRLMSLIPGSDIEPGFNVVSYSTEIETEVDSIYRQMYDEQTTIDDVITMLQRHKESENLHEREIFACMLHFLFDEYKFFQSYYPARELSMTAYLFGSLIQHQLVENIPLGIAIRYIVDALNCPPDTNLFRFGVTALSRCESRLPEWQPVCSRLLQIPHLAEARPDLYATLQRALAIAENSNNTDARNGIAPEPTPVFTAIRPDIIDGEIENPPEDLSDRILFIINNLAPTNFDTKVAEMRQHFDDQHARWLANYLVDQRIATEPNNHSLYLRFLDALDRTVLSKLVLQETFVKSAAMLNSERCMQSQSDRNTLKNVASFLGSITLARDRPIKFKTLSFKDLLVEGYESGRLLVAIPFVCKTLEPCARSRVFQAPNPWLMGVLSLLAELYQFADLKLNLKFEIELLCEALDVALASIETSTILRTRPLADAGPQMPEYVGDISSLPIDDYTTTHTTSEPPVIGLGAASPSDPTRAVGAHIEAILATLALHVQISSHLGQLSVNHAFKRAVTLAVDRAVREIIVPVVERSVTIAGISTRELVTKDFATESNEDKLRKAAHLMAQKLAGSLALVTCKEPLKSNMTTHIRQFLLDNGFNDYASDQVIALLVQDNIDVACNAIEKAAMERAVSDVDDAFVASYDVRRRHRESRNVQSFWDPAAAPSSFAVTLPDPLRVKANGLQPHQSVYEDFGIDSKRSLVGISRPSSTTSFAPGLYASSPTPDSAPVFNHQEAMDRFAVLTRDLEAVVAQLPGESLANLAGNHDLRHLIRQVMILAANSGDRARTPLTISQKIVQLLYKTQLQLGREVYVVLLEQLCQSFDDVAKEAITWLLYAEDERKFNVPVTVTLLRSGLLNIALLDQQLAKVMYGDQQNPRPSLFNYVAALIRECLSYNPPVATQSQFHFSLEILTTFSRESKTTDEVNKLLDDLRGVRRAPDAARATPPVKQSETEQLRERLFHWFQQWVQIFQRSTTPEKSFIPFITQLTKQGILKVEDLSSFFFRVCAEASVNHYVKCMSTGEFDFAFQGLDAMSRLIVYMIKYHGDSSGVNNDQAKVHYLTKILSIFVLVLANMHEEQGPAFQQKPFFRFFSSLTNDLQAIESQLGPVYFPLLIAISDTLSSLQPTYFPGFAFSWMCLISHRSFMPKLLLWENREGWSAFHKLLLSLFRFLSPFLKDSNLQLPSKDLYRGALRLLLVLLHDFPEFLSEYYFSLCDVIPPRCIQLRNIVLSAFPPSLILPDPHLRNVPFESIPEMGPVPPILSDFSAPLKNADLGHVLEQFVLNRGNPALLPTLKNRLRLPGVPENAPDGFNLSVINALVMYTGVSSVAQAKARTGSALFVATDPGVVLLQYLANNLNDEGKHHLLSAMVLHLRYPNAHTHWFTCLLLHLFVEVKDDRFREIMTKVLLERFIVHRPHPWGALVTFIELLRNPKYDFWSKEFVRIAPEVTMLLESVARSIFS